MRPRDEGAKIGVSLRIGDDAIRDDVRCWLVRIGRAVADEIGMAELSTTGDTGDVFGSGRRPAVVWPDDGGGTVRSDVAACSIGNVATGVRFVGTCSGTEPGLSSMIAGDDV